LHGELPPLVVIIRLDAAAFLHAVDAAATTKYLNNHLASVKRSPNLQIA
jgi:hypothetical protein